MQNANFSNHNLNEDVIDIKQIITALKSNRRLIAIVTLLFIMIGIAYCLMRTPQYTSNLLLDTGNENPAITGALSSLASGLGMSNNNSATAKEPSIITSRSVVEPTIKKLHLDIVVQAEYFPLIGEFLARHYQQNNYANTPAPAKFGLSHYSWGGDQIQITDLSISPDLFNQTFQLVYQGNNQYQLYSDDKLLLVGKIGQTAAWQANDYTNLKLMVTAIHARPGVTFTVKKLPMEMALAQVRNQLQVTPAKSGAGILGSSSILNLNYADRDPVLAAATLNTIAKETIKQDIASKMLQAERSAVLLKSQIPIVQQALAQAEQQLNAYQTKSGNIELSATSKLLLTQLAQVDSKLADLQLQRAEMAEQYTPQSFQIQQIDTAIQQIQAQQTVLNQKLLELPQAEQSLIDLLRNAKLQNAIYVGLMNKIAQTEIIKADTTSTIVVVDPADIPDQSNNKTAATIILLAAILGLILSSSIALIKMLFYYNKFDLDVVPQKTGLPMLVIHRVPEQERQRHSQKQPLAELQLLSEIAPDSVAQQDFHHLRATLLFKLAQAKQKTLIVTSLDDPETQSFFSANLAQALSETGRVLLIDANSASSVLSVYFGLSNKPGLMELAQQHAALNDIAHPTRIPNLHFISTGQLNSRHNEIILHPICQEILPRCTEHYDFILINTDFHAQQNSILTLASALKLLVLSQKHYSQTEVVEKLQKHAHIQFTSIILTDVRGD